MPPPLPPAAKDALLNDLDIAMQRPPSLITPEDAEGARGPLSCGGVCGAGLPSLGLSSGGLGSLGTFAHGDFGVSPGALVSQLLGTPTPHGQHTVAQAQQMTLAQAGHLARTRAPYLLYAST